MKTPFVSCPVHYVRDYDSFHVAAIITEVLDAEKGVVSLCLFPPNSNGYSQFKEYYDARMTPGTWHYPEHVNTVSYHESEGPPPPEAGEYKE